MAATLPKKPLAPENARVIPTGRLEGNHSSLRIQWNSTSKTQEKIAEQDFYKRSIHTKTERFGDMAQVISTYHISQVIRR